MIYQFPIRVNLRKFLPSAEQVLGEVEKHFKAFTGESIGIVVTTQVMTLQVTTPVPLNVDQINLAKSTLYPLLIEKFPNADIEIGEPVITGTKQVTE
jgi:hypothetical protein